MGGRCGSELVERYKPGFLDRLLSFSFSHFGALGFYLNRKFKSIGEKMELAQIRIHPASYFSLAFFVSIMVGLVSGLFALFMYLEVSGLTRLIFFHLTFNFLGSPVSTYGLVVAIRDNFLLNILFLRLFPVFPFLTFIFFLLIPDIKLSLWTESLEAETPFIGAYVSVMATGGVSPYSSIKTFVKSKLLPTFSRVAERIYTLVTIFGEDPLTAIEKTSKRVPSKDLKELLLGYVTSVRTGGDFVHFLFTKTEALFRERVTKMRQIGERIGILMESYVAMTVLLSLGIYSIFIVNTTLPVPPNPFFSGGTFFLFAYIVTPFLSLLFIYLVDLFSPKYPSTDWSIHKVAVLSVASVTVFFSLFFFIPSLNPVFLQVIPFAKEVNAAFKSFVLGLGFQEGTETPVLLSIFFVAALTPPAIIELKRGREESNIEENMALFLRDLVETRKAGLPPEKCIMQLRDKDYGYFSKRLRSIANQISWGVPLREIYKYFASSTRNWLTRMLTFLLVEAIDYGGGSVKTLETLARYSEMMNSVRKEKEGALKPLLLVPYIGVLILIASVVLLIGFMNLSMKLAGSGVAYKSLLTMFLTPIILNTVLAGLVAGKVSSGTIVAGFKHSLLLLVIALIALWLTPWVTNQLTSLTQFTGA